MSITRECGKSTKFCVESKYKPLVMSTRYKKSPYTARAIFHLKSTLKSATIVQVKQLVKREVHFLCSRKHGDSVLRLSDTSAITKFTWGSILRELHQESPTLYAFLRAVLFRRKRKLHLRNVGMSACMLLKSRNKDLGLVQGVISLVMYAGHSSKQVGKSPFEVMCDLSMCMFVYRLLTD